MKKILFFSPFLLTLIFLLNSCSNNKNKNQTKVTNIQENKTITVKSGVFQIDQTNSNIEWIGEKTTGSHNGNIKLKKGFIEIDQNGNISNGEFTLNMESINCTDLEGKRKISLEEHLKDGDFFDTQKYH